jgi:hypothetical protein
MAHQETENKRWPLNLAGGILVGLVLGLIVGLIDGDLLEGLGFGFVIGLAMGAAFERRHHLMRYPPGMIRRIIIAGGVFLVALIASLELKEYAGYKSLQIALTIAPVIGFTLVVFAIGSALASLDELQRRIQTEAIALGFGFTAIAVTTVGFLEDVGLTQPGWIYVVFPMTIGWGLGKLWTVWKYR